MLELHGNEEPAKKLSFVEQMKDFYSRGVTELWFESHGSDPDRQSAEWNNFLQTTLSPIVFTEESLSSNSITGLEKDLMHAAARRFSRLLNN